MFRRLRLPGKLVLAAVPLVLALGAVSTLFAQTTFAEADEERKAADLSAVLVELRDAVETVAAEADDPTGGRPATDAALSSLTSSVSTVEAPPLSRQLEAVNRRLDQIRARLAESRLDQAAVYAAYDQVAGDLLAIASLIPAEVSNEESARSLEGLSAIGRARQVARTQQRVILDAVASADGSATTLDRIRDLQFDFVGWVDLFHTVASSDARTIFAQSGAPVAIGGVSTQVTRLVEPTAGAPEISPSDWEQLLDERNGALATFEERLTGTVGERAVEAADQATLRAWSVVAAAAAALVLAAVLTALISRSIVRRVRSVTVRAQHVAQEQLPALVEALRDPGDDAVLPAIPPIRDRGADEVGDLARSFAAMQSTLEHVAEQQVETLRKGVAEMFVTLARRNRSLIDRQLALIDELESDEQDPEALADYYRLDHMATRMRRNAESLLVLAGSEPPRTWRSPMGVDDVVRAAIGEIEDYRRIDVLTLESVKLKGSVVADLSHLLSELLENAAQFSPPQTRVRVSGHFHEEGYLVTVSDRGVGIPSPRLAELNHLLERPPIVGLALEPTLGLYVVAMLAKRHGIQVRLIAGAPGVSAKLLIPPGLYDTVVTPEPMAPRRVAGTPPEQPAIPPARRAGIGSVRTGIVDAPAAQAAPPTPPTQPADPSSPRPLWTPPPPVVGPDERRRAANGAPPAPTELPTRPVPTAPPRPDVATLRPPPPAPSERRAAPLHASVEAPPLPVRTPGSDGASVPRPASSPARTVPTDGLPVRRPGASYADDPAAERPVSGSQRSPDAVRSSFGAFQTGYEAGRRHASEGEDE